MGLRQSIPLIAPTYSRPGFTGATTQRLINRYIESFPNTNTNRNSVAAIKTPGTSAYINLNGHVTRGIFNYQNTYLYAIVDSNCYEISNLTSVTPTVTNLGTIQSSTGRITWAASPFNQIVFCDGTNAYAITNNVLVQLSTVSSFNSAVTVPVIAVTAKDGFFIYITNTNNTVFVSNLQDAKTVSTSSFFEVQANYDILLAGTVSDYFVYFIGQTTTEIWYDAGTAIQPFALQAGGILQIGTAAANSSLCINEFIYWLAQNPSGVIGVVAANGPNYSIISDANFNTTIQSYSKISDAYAWGDVLPNGHTCYNITFPSADIFIQGLQTLTGATWSYDTIAQFWFERQTYNPIIRTNDRHITNCSAYVAGQQIVGDFQSGNLYVLSGNNKDDYINGTIYPMEWTIISPHIIDRNTRFSMYNLELDFERGVGLSSGQGINPAIMLQYSKDRGNTWSAPRILYLDQLGNYSKRTRLGSLGGGFSMTIKLTGSDPIVDTIYGASAEFALSDMSYNRMLGFE